MYVYIKAYIFYLIINGKCYISRINLIDDLIKFIIAKKKTLYTLYFGFTQSAVSPYCSYSV
jgi:hypothetical protein